MHGKAWEGAPVHGGHGGPAGQEHKLEGCPGAGLSPAPGPA